MARPLSAILFTFIRQSCRRNYIKCALDSSLPAINLLALTSMYASKLPTLPSKSSLFRWLLLLLLLLLFSPGSRTGLRDTLTPAGTSTSIALRTDIQPSITTRRGYSIGHVSAVLLAFAVDAPPRDQTNTAKKSSANFLSEKTESIGARGA